MIFDHVVPEEVEFLSITDAKNCRNRRCNFFLPLPRFCVHFYTRCRLLFFATSKHTFWNQGTVFLDSQHRAGQGNMARSRATKVPHCDDFPVLLPCLVLLISVSYCPLHLCFSYHAPFHLVLSCCFFCQTSLSLYSTSEHSLLLPALSLYLPLKMTTSHILPEILHVKHPDIGRPVHNSVSSYRACSLSSFSGHPSYTLHTQDTQYRSAGRRRLQGLV